jgi:hypothetical protein
LDPEVEKTVLSQNRKETECSVCGRFIGSWEICPFCRHYNPKRWQVRLIKYSSPVLTILGIFLLVFLGRVYGTPEVRVAELGRKANFAQVRIQGRVADEIRFHPAEMESGFGTRSLEFDVDDGTGVIRIRCYEDAFDEIRAADNIPGFGDRIELIGNYQYKARRQFVILSSTHDLRIDREKPAQATPILQVFRPEEYGLSTDQRVKVTGRVKSVEEGVYERTAWIEDPAGVLIPITISKSVLQAYGSANAGTTFFRKLRAGDYISCFGSLAESRTRKDRHWQVVPASPGDIGRSDETAWNNDNAGK